MIIVVSDTSPIRALHHLGLLDLCRALYGSVVIPDAVRLELLQPTTMCPLLEIREFPWFETRAPNAKPCDLGVPDDLDAGEAGAIALTEHPPAVDQYSTDQLAT